MQTEVFPLGAGSATTERQRLLADVAPQRAHFDGLEPRFSELANEARARERVSAAAPLPAHAAQAAAEVLQADGVEESHHDRSLRHAPQLSQDLDAFGRRRDVLQEPHAQRACEGAVGERQRVH